MNILLHKITQSQFELLSGIEKVEGISIMLTFTNEGTRKLITMANPVAIITNDFDDMADCFDQTRIFPATMRLEEIIRAIKTSNLSINGNPQGENR